MKINPKRALVDLDGKSIFERIDEDGNPEELTLGKVVYTTLLTPAMQSMSKMSGEVKAAWYSLALSIHAAQEADEMFPLNIDSAKLLKDAVGQDPRWPPIVVGQVWKILEEGGH